MVRTFSEQTIEEMKQNIEYGFYSVLSNFPYGNFNLGVFNERGEILVTMFDDDGHACVNLTKGRFLELLDEECGVEKYLNEVIYYNYQEEGAEE